jgi:hypothetical protein
MLLPFMSSTDSSHESDVDVDHEDQRRPAAAVRLLSLLSRVSYMARRQNGAR